MITSNTQRTLYFHPLRNCEQIRNVSFASSSTVVAAWNRVRLLNARGHRVSSTSRGWGCRVQSRLGRHRPREGAWGWGPWCLPENKKIRGVAGGDLDHRLNYLVLDPLGGLARHILPPLSPSQPVIAEKKISCWG